MEQSYTEQHAQDSDTSRRQVQEPSEQYVPHPGPSEHALWLANQVERLHRELDKSVRRCD